MSAYLGWIGFLMLIVPLGGGFLYALFDSWRRGKREATYITVTFAWIVCAMILILGVPRP